MKAFEYHLIRKGKIHSVRWAVGRNEKEARDQVSRYAYAYVATGYTVVWVGTRRPLPE